MESTFKLQNKALQLLETDKLLKFNQEILEGFIRPIEEEIFVITILGTTTANPFQIANKMIEKLHLESDCHNNINSNEGIDGFQEFTKAGINIYTGLFNHKATINMTKVIILVVGSIEKKEFTNKILGMIHSISSILILASDKANLSDIEVISSLKKAFTGSSYPDEMIKNLSPKLVFCFIDNDYSNNSNNNLVNEITEKLEKEDIISESYVKYYRERKVVVLNKEEMNKVCSGDEKVDVCFDGLMKIIFVDSLCKSYRGKKLNGLTLRNMLIEFVNCINQGISFNINKM